MSNTFQVQFGSSKLPQKFYTGEVDAFWRTDTSFEESRRNYLVERDKIRDAQKIKCETLSNDVKVYKYKIKTNKKCLNYLQSVKCSHRFVCLDHLQLK